MSVGGAPDVPGHPEFAYRCDLYTRYRLINPATPFFAQVLLIDSDQCTLGVDVDGVALGVDFRTESTRPDVPGRQRERPGIRIAERLAEARDNGHRSVLVNGNNVGYWGNQFAFRDGNLVYKERGPIFDDGELAAHATGEYPFFYGSQDGFFFRKVRLSSTTVGLDTVVTSPDPESTPPPAGLSGYPLVWGGKPVWSRTEHLDMVWDPRLVFEVGRLVGIGRRQAVELVRRHFRERRPWALHPMTAVGVDRNGRAVLVVMEQSPRSRGISLGGMAEIMDVFDVCSAVVLGAAGDAQLATTEEGVLVAPQVAPYAESAAREVPPELCHPDLDGLTVKARPVPSLVTLAAVPERPTATPARPLTRAGALPSA